MATAITGIRSPTHKIAVTHDAVNKVKISPAEFREYLKKKTKLLEKLKL